MLNCLLSLCLSLGLGQSVAGPQDCGIWYMCGPQYPHTLHLRALSESFGVESQHWRAGYQGLGRFGADAAAISSSNPADIACAPGCWPISRWHGDGTVRGIYLEGVYHAGPFSFELGPWLYRATWQETVVGWTPTATAAPITLNVSNDKTSLGAAGGIGSAISHALARQGARLALSGTNPAKLRAFREELNEAYGHDHVEITCDLSNTEQVEHLVPAAVDTLGKLDILSSLLQWED